MSEYDAKKVVAMADARDAVIEAAKAWYSAQHDVVHDLRQDDYVHYYEAKLVDLLVAIEALQEVEQ